MSEGDLIKISEAADEAKVLTSTIRHYTDIGLLRVAGYSDGGHRLYSREETLDRLNRIQALSKRGLSLSEIKKEFESKEKVKKILIVDDEVEVVEVITELFKLKNPEWQLKVATDGFMAGRMLSEFYPDLVILDLMLPGVDGFDICRHIRQDSELKGVIILAITGYDSPEMKKKIMDSGADDYLAKPMDNKVLVEKVQKLLSQK